MLGYEASRAQTVKTVLNLIIFISILVIGTVILAAFARGYTFDPRSGEVIRYGLVQVESQPTNAQVVLDDVLLGEATPWKEALNEGTYLLKLQRKDFQNWERAFEVKGGEVINFTYPLLVPNSSTFTAFRPIVSQHSPSFSPNRSYLIRRVENEIVLQNLNTVDKTDTIETPRAVAGLELAKTTWSKNEDEALLQFGTGSAARYVVLDINRDTLTSVTEFIDGYKIMGLISGTDSLAIATTDNQNVLLINLETGGRTVLSQGATNVTWVNGTVVWYDLSEGRLMGYRDDKRIRVPTLNDVTADTRIFTSEYDGGLNVVYQTHNQLNVIVSSLSEPFERRVENIDKVHSFSPNGRYVLYVADGTLNTYDLKDFRVYKSGIELSDVHNITWANGSHLTALRGNEHLVFDFDGQNIHVIARLDAEETFLSNNLAYSYALSGKSGSQTLHRIELAPAELLN